MQGRLAALLELGSGFNPEFIGLEDIRLNAAIPGLDPRNYEERLRDIIACIGADFWRLRLGVGHPGHKDLVLNWVLRDFDREERDAQTGWLPKVLDALAEESALLVEGTAKTDERYMSRVAHLAPPPKPPEEPKA